MTWTSTLATVAALMYCSALLWAILTPTETVISTLHELDPRIGDRTPRVESYWNVHCDLEWTWSAMSDLMLAQLDLFFLSHIVGWLAKAIVYPNIYVLLISGILFEFCEIVLDDHLANFKECWWDHWIVDFLLCNGLGLVVGLLLVPYVERDARLMKGYYSISKPLHLFFHAAAVYGFSLLDVHAFILKDMFLIPVSHPFNPLRLVLVGVLGYHTSRDALHLGFCKAMSTRRYRSIRAPTVCFLLMIGLELVLMLRFVAEWNGE
eukprot:m.20904 g.20904  ORF g.20904 m.20904 type:complete len:264 (-) comp11066_c0_seq1:33-824(-)